MKEITRKNVITRLSKIEGQVRGLKRLLEEKKYCIDIINQSLAVKSALSAMEDVVLESHLETCVDSQMRNGNKGKAIKEIVEVYKLSKKK